jgi:hypothetical protein
VLADTATDNKTWRAQSEHQPVVDMNPHGIKLFLERADAAAKCSVQITGEMAGIVQYLEPGSGAAHPKRAVELNKKTCGCLEYHEVQFPCKDAIALALKLNKAANLFVRDNAHESYKIRATELQAIAGSLSAVLPPSGAELLQRARNPAAAEILEQFESGPSLEGLGLDSDARVKAPPKRVTEPHGNSKRKRKISGKGQRGKVASTGRTRTRTFTAAANTTAVAVNEARQRCKLCTRAGRTDVEPHKSTLCPFNSDVPTPEVVMLSDNEVV